MKINNRKKHYCAYNKEQNWKTSLTLFVYQYLISQKELIPKNLKWNHLLYLISKVEYKVLTFMNNKGIGGFVEITSKELKSWRYDYNKYLEFLIGIGIISKKNYSTTSKKCNSYRINYDKIFQHGVREIELTEIEIHNCDDNVKKQKNTSSLNVLDCKHLTKWLEYGFEFDDVNFKYIGHKLICNIYDDEYKNITRALNYLHKINDIKNKNIRYSRNWDSDNRLHSYLTNFPSTLRGYLTFKGFDIISYDVKNSQPFFLIIFIEGFINGDIRIMNIYEKLYNKGIMSPKLLETLSSKEFQEQYIQIKKWILNGEFYENLSEYLDIKIQNKLFVIKKYTKSLGYKKYYFETKREASKIATMELLYSPNKKDKKVFKEFKSKFPKFWELLDILKTESDDKDAYKKFPKLLQHIEADCVIDFVTKKISEIHPDIPIFTIHDSICTIDIDSDVIYRLIKKYISEYSGGILPSIKEEFWGLPIKCPKAA